MLVGFFLQTFQNRCGTMKARKTGFNILTLRAHKKTKNT